MPRTLRLMMHIRIVCNPDVLDEILAELRAREAHTFRVIGTPNGPTLVVETDAPSARLWGFPSFVHSLDEYAGYAQRVFGYAPAGGPDGSAGRSVRPKPSRPPTLTGFAEAVPDLLPDPG